MRRKVIIALVAAIILAGFGGSCIYRKGQEAGASEQKASVEGDLKVLGKAVEEKAELTEKLDELNREAPEEVDGEAIDGYVGKLKEVISSCEDMGVKALLEDYQSAWEKLGEVYAAKDNEAIEKELETVRTKAEEVAGEVTEIYNGRIKAAAEKLGE